MISDKPKASDQSKKKSEASLCACLHREILDLWTQYFPGKTQPNKNLWDQQTAATHLKARWRETGAIVHSSGTRTFYSNREDGLEWWGNFFKYISSRCKFLMSDDAQFSNLAWLVKKANFMKTLDQNYEARK